ncbi:MAG: response regulator [Acidobacteria bacterium]|nr:response regulator [Acidobacteriota bacterium]MCI0624540.1 response regulator [Acidobacteriota bacterium]MCI0721007.1 response regulator [Acidobacteriota bacterium]
MNAVSRRPEYPSPKSRGFPKKSILLVESDLDLRLMLSMLLEEEGCAVDACGSLSEALRTVAEKRFDFVITAHATPGIDGLALLEALKESGADVPAVVISSRYEKEPYITAMNLGALDYFIKPLDYSAIQKLIHRQTKSRE